MLQAIGDGVSPTLAANERVLELRAEGRTIFHMGFGQAPFPAPQRMVDALKHNAHQHAYLPVAGLPELRHAIAHHQAKHTGIDPDKYDVIIGPGSKLILFALQMAIPGDLLLPVPSWVSYAPQAKLLGQQVIPVYAESLAGSYGLNESILTAAINAARKAGKQPTKLLINFPSNPTGLTILNDDLVSIAEFCKKQDITLISDEIYGRLAFDKPYRSAAASFPEGTIVTTGLSKHLSLGGWRLGACLVPRQMSTLVKNLHYIASETWSCVSAPIQYAAIEAYADHADIEQFIKETAAIHRAVNSYIAQRFNTMGVACPTPQGGFYTWPDFTSVRATEDLTTAAELVHVLLEQHSIVSLPGSAFGVAADVLKLRIAGCDYDGGVALDFLHRSPQAKLTEGLQTFAPNVVSAMNEFEKFVS